MSIVTDHITTPIRRSQPVQIVHQKPELIEGLTMFFCYGFAVATHGSAEFIISFGYAFSTTVKYRLIRHDFKTAAQDVVKASDK